MTIKVPGCLRRAECAEPYLARVLNLQRAMTCLRQQRLKLWQDDAGTTTSKGLTPLARHRTRYLLDDDGALHERRVTRKATEELIRAVTLHLADREADRGGLAAANHVGMSDNTVIASLDVILRKPRGDAIGGNFWHVRQGGDDDVVAHGRNGHLADVLERDLKVRA